MSFLDEISNSFSSSSVWLWPGNAIPLSTLDRLSSTWDCISAAAVHSSLFDIITRREWKRRSWEFNFDFSEWPTLFRTSFFGRSSYNVYTTNMHSEDVRVEEFIMKILDAGWRVSTCMKMEEIVGIPRIEVFNSHRHCSRYSAYNDVWHERLKVRTCKHQLSLMCLQQQKVQQMNLWRRQRERYQTWI